MARHFVIIGGGIAGTVAAEKLRAGDRKASITLIEQEPYRVYNKTLLPSVLQGHIDPKSIFLRTERWYAAQRIDVHFATEIVVLNQSAKTVQDRSGKVFAYDQLILALGGQAKTIRAAQLSGKTGYTFRTYADAEALQPAIAKAKSVSVVGGGFIALELLQTMHHYGKSAELLVRGASLFGDALHPQGAMAIVNLVQSYGTQVYFKARTSDIKPMPGSVITLGIGSDTQPAWLKKTSLLGKHGIRVNQFLQTVDPTIYACGDCARFTIAIAP